MLGRVSLERIGLCEKPVANKAYDEQTAGEGVVYGISRAYASNAALAGVALVVAPQPHSGKASERPHRTSLALVQSPMVRITVLISTKDCTRYQP
jgi:hypothetical protein